VAKPKNGLDFGANDGKPTKLILLVLTGDNQAQNDLLLAAADLFSRREAIEQALNAETFVELVAALNAPVQ
jgi:mannitol/fructose-specific phosphotransferase system IIA component (Ntr-type)